MTIITKKCDYCGGYAVTRHRCDGCGAPRPIESQQSLDTTTCAAQLIERDIAAIWKFQYQRLQHEWRLAHALRNP